MIFSQKAKGILGMNARNLLYISKYNSHANKKFADDKIFTKQFLESRNIGVAKLYQIVKNHHQLTQEFFRTLPESFVIKPNRGFAGGGILVISNSKEGSWYTTSGKKYTEDVLYRHCLDILEGKYSISGTTDQVIFEERLDPHTDFRHLTQSGLPDVRVIVFNMVPVMAMLRVPTPASDGKANMELGAIAMGVDLGNGKTTGAALYSKFIKKLPNGESAIGFQVPFWDEILLSVSKIQQVTNIGFLGVDLVVTTSGVKVLEVNARPGLKIQVANKALLQERLNKVSDLKVLSPEDGVDIAKTLFSQKITKDEEFSKKPIIGVKESVIWNTEDGLVSLVAKIDLHANNNKISKRYMSKIDKILDITISENRLKLPVEAGTVGDCDLIIAGKFLQDFYIDPTKEYEIPQKRSNSQVDQKMLLNLDQKLCDIESQIKLLSYINPRNIAEQKVIFLSHTGFSPRFLYKKCDLDITYLRNDLKKIPDINHELMPLYKKKVSEIDLKLNLLESLNSNEFGDISKKIFGGVSKALYLEALKFIQNHKIEFKKDESAILDLKKTTEVLEKFLADSKLSHWSIKVLEDSVADIQVTKKEAILLRKGATFQENRLKALLVHEIGTHVFRYENGKRQPLRILERGTAGHLQTEEGLAIYNQNQLGLDLGDKYLTPAYLVVATYMASKMSFEDLFHYLQATFDLSNELAWKLCLKTKRGLKNTATKTAFTKDVIYFAGNKEVEKYIQKGGSMKDLYVGKIGIKDLPLIQKIEGLQEPKFLL